MTRLIKLSTPKLAKLASSTRSSSSIAVSSAMSRIALSAMPPPSPPSASAAATGAGSFFATGSVGVGGSEASLFSALGVHIGSIGVDAPEDVLEASCTGRGAALAFAGSAAGFDARAGRGFGGAAAALEELLAWPASGAEKKRLRRMRGYFRKVMPPTIPTMASFCKMYTSPMNTEGSSAVGIIFT